MAVTNYYTVDGHILGEATSGVRTDYLTDALGSITATVDQGAAVLNTYRHKPYGGLLAKTGNSPDPKFLWTGGTGSRKTGLAFSDQYNQARHYGTSQAQWSTGDKYWPQQYCYVYCSSNPANLSDPFGHFPDFIGCGDTRGKLAECCHRLAGVDKNKVKECMRRVNYGVPGFDDRDVDWFLGLLTRLCTMGGKANAVCVRCGSWTDVIPDWSPNCPNPCREGYWGFAWPESGMVVPGPGRGGPDHKRCGLDVILDPDCSGAHIGTGGSPCPCSIIMCNSGLSSPVQDMCALFYHELAHCSGLGHIGGEPLPSGIRTDRVLDFIYKLGCCICIATKGDQSCGSECKRVL